MPEAPGRRHDWSLVPTHSQRPFDPASNTRVSLAIWVLLAVCLIRTIGGYAGNLLQLKKELHSTPGATHEIHYLRGVVPVITDPTAYYARFVPIRALLPPTGMVGYVSDLPPVRDLDQDIYQSSLVLAQNALSPLKVRTDKRCEWVVGNFDRPDGARSVKEPSLELVKDAGNGVVLFRRKRS